MVGTLIFGFVAYQIFAPLRYALWAKRMIGVGVWWLQKEAIDEALIDDRGLVDRTYMHWQEKAYGFSDHLLPYRLVPVEHEEHAHPRFRGMFIFTERQHAQLMDFLEREASKLPQVVDAQFILDAGRAAWAEPELRKEALENEKRLRVAK